MANTFLSWRIACCLIYILYHLKIFIMTSWGRHLHNFRQGKACRLPCKVPSYKEPVQSVSCQNIFNGKILAFARELMYGSQRTETSYATVMAIIDHLTSIPYIPGYKGLLGLETLRNHSAWYYIIYHWQWYFHSVYTAVILYSGTISSLDTILITGIVEAVI